MEGLAGVFMVFGVFALFALIFAFNKSRYTRQVRDFRAFEERNLTDGRLAFDDGWFPSLEGLALSGKLDGRRVSVGFRVVGGGKNRQVYTVFKVDVPNAVPGFTVEPVGVMKRLGRFLGLVKDVPTGNQSVDDKYIVSGQRGSLRQLFSSRELERGIDDLIAGMGATSLKLSGRRLHVEVRGVITSPAKLRRMFDLLVSVAQQCERREVRVKVLGEKPRFAITGGTGHAVCPYCRDDVSLDGDAVMACEGCNTVHHTECYAEAGGCTIYGCGRQRVRA